MLLATFCIALAQQNYLAGLLVVGASSLGVFWGEGSFLLRSGRPVDPLVQSVVEIVCAAVSAVMGAFCRDGLALCVFDRLLTRLHAHCLPAVMRLTVET